MPVYSALPPLILPYPALPDHNHTPPIQTTQSPTTHPLNNNVVPTPIPLATPPLPASAPSTLSTPRMTPAPSHHTTPASSSSDLSPVQSKKRKQMTMPNQTEVVATHHKQKHLPVMSDGEIVPCVVKEFETLCKNYSLQTGKAIPVAECVPALFGRFESPIVLGWLTSEYSWLTPLSFPKFTTKFQAEWLSEVWEEDYWKKIYDACLEPEKENFFSWMANIRQLNAALCGSPSYLEPKELCHCLESGLDKDLKGHACLEHTNNLTDLSKWIQKIRDIDSWCQTEHKCFLTNIEDHIGHLLKKANVGSSSCTNTTTNTTPKTTNMTSMADTGMGSMYPPHLTDAECQLLHEHNGCFKSHEFYADHRSDACMVCLSGTNYKTRTVQDAVHAKAVKDGKFLIRRPVIALTSDANPDHNMAPATKNLVAALFPDYALTTLEDEASFGTDSNTLGVSSTPLKCNHLIWDCTLTGPTGSFPVNVLLNSGAHIVLIHSALALKLSLHLLPLEKPKLVNITINTDDGPLAICHFVNIAPLSLHMKFLSKQLQAIVVPNLSVPLILGLPFLISNSISCNYAMCECNVVQNSKMINLLKKLTIGPFKVATYFFAYPLYCQISNK